MSAAQLLSQATVLGVRVELSEDGQLRVDYPKGAAVEGMLAALAQHKAYIIATVQQAPRLALYVCGECDGRFWNLLSYFNADGCPRCLGRINLSEVSFPTETSARAFLTEKKAKYGVKLYGIDDETRRPQPPLPKSVRAALDFLSRTGWTKPLPPKMVAWLEGDANIIRFEHTVYGK